MLLLSCICGIPAYFLLGIGTVITQTATISQDDVEITLGEEATINEGEVGTIGEPVERAGVTLTVFSAERMSEFEGETPFSDSDVFVVVELQLENNGSESMQTGTQPFELLSRDGDFYSADMMADPGEVEFGFLDVGDETRGRLVFEVDESADIEDLVLNYSPIEFASEDIAPLQVALTDTPGTAAAPAGEEENDEDEDATPTPADAPTAEEDDNATPTAEADATPTPADEEEPTPEEDDATPTAEEDDAATPTAEADDAAAPTPAPVDTDAPLSTVTNGANLRSEPRIAPDTVLAQVCPNDQVRILEEQGSWYRIQVAQMGDDCPVTERATVGLEGWISQELLSEPSETLPVAEAEPQATATQEATAEAEPEATAAAAESAAEPGTIEGSVINGGNLRSEPRLAPETVIGQVCPGDQATILEERTVEGILWYQIRVDTTGPDCIAERVPAGTEGWLSSVLLSIQ